MVYTTSMTEDADKRAMYAAMKKKDLARLAAQTGQETYTGFLTRYDKEELVDFILAEYELSSDLGI